MANLLLRGAGGLTASRPRPSTTEDAAALSLVMIDLLLLACLVIGMSILHGRVDGTPIDWFDATLLAFPLTKLACGLYPGHGLIRAVRMRRIVLANAAAFLIVLAGAAVGAAGSHDPRHLLTAAVAAALLALSDPLARRLLIRLGRWQQPVFIFGAGDAASEVIRQLRLDPHLGYRPVCLVDDTSVYIPDDQEGVPLVRSRELSRHAEQIKAATTAIVIEHIVERSSLQRLCTSGVFERVLLVPECHDLISLKSAVNTLGGVLTIEVRSERLNRVQALIKRTSDTTLSSLAILFLSPLLLLLAVLVRLDSPGPALYRQTRWAGDDRTFDAIKFRSMHIDGDKRLRRHFLTNPAAQRQYERFHKLDDDPRVTRVGRFIRKTSLDELPQLLNVVRGEMSLVGPRPYTLDELSKLGPARPILSLVRPGITGYWQVSGRNQRTFRERIAMDCYYVRNMSLSLDIWILYRTVIAVLTGEGK